MILSLPSSAVSRSCKCLGFVPECGRDRRSLMTEHFPAQPTAGSQRTQYKDSATESWLGYDRAAEADIRGVSVE